MPETTQELSDLPLEEEGLKILQGIQDVDLDPTEVDVLFHVEQPLIMDDARRAVVVEALRRARKEYLLKKETKRKAKAKKAPVTEIEGIKLEDLDLDMIDQLPEK